MMHITVICFWVEGLSPGSFFIHQYSLFRPDYALKVCFVFVLPLDLRLAQDSKPQSDPRHPLVLVQIVLLPFLG